MRQGFDIRWMDLSNPPDTDSLRIALHLNPGLGQFGEDGAAVIGHGVADSAQD